MNPEFSAMRNLDRRTRPDEIKEVAAPLLYSAESVRRRLSEVAFDPNTFADLYSEENVAKDLRYVEDRKRAFQSSSDREVSHGLTEQDVKDLSERVEYEVIRGINAGRWFEGVGAYKTSEYDDIANGVDVVLEMLNQNTYGHLGLGLDITFSQNVEKKFKRIKGEIDAYDGEKSRLGRVKYFNSKNTGIRGELGDLARAVVAIDLPMLKDMVEAKKPDSLHSHMSKHITLLEIQQQLATFLRYAERSNSLAAQPIERASSFIQTMVENLDSEGRVRQSEYRKNRRADDALLRGLAIFD